MSPADADHPATTGVHVGLLAADTGLIDAFWRAGLDAGLADDDAPGNGGLSERAVYHPGYCASFVLDPDGHTVGLRPPTAGAPRPAHPPDTVDHHPEGCVR